MNLPALRRWSVFALLLFVILLLQILPGRAQSGDPALPALPLKEQPERMINPPQPHFEGEPPALPDPAGPQYTYWDDLFFQAYRSENWEIISKTGSNGTETNLSNHSAADSRPRLTRDRSMVVFQSNRANATNIYRLNADGSGLLRLTVMTGANYAPAWSPDGQKIVFVSNRDTSSTGPGEIYVMNADGSSQARLTFSGLENGSPAWSPDGSRIAFVRYSGAYGALWLMNPDGSEAHPISGNAPYLGHPTWSPDGSRIAFDADLDGDNWNELALMNADGSGVQILVNPSNWLYDVLAGDWSDSGQNIITSYVYYEYYEGQYYIRTTALYELRLEDLYYRAITSGGREMYPDYSCIDPWPPVSEILPLPAFTRYQSQIEIPLTAMDIGPSGLMVDNFQLRIGRTSDWVRQGVNPRFGVIEKPSAEQTLYFRARFRDGAGNLEAWPDNPDGEAWTNIFHSLLKVQVFDPRELPVTEAQVNVSPENWENSALTGAAGQAELHSKATGMHTVQASAAAFRPVGPLGINLNFDAGVSLYLPAAGDILTNSSFEQGLTGWRTDGDLPANTAVGFQEQSAVLGLNCPELCLGGLEQPFPANSNAYPDLAVDAQNRVHMVYAVNNEIYYTRRDLDGAWLPPQKLGPVWTATGDNGKYRIAVDGLGGIHIIGSGHWLRYFYRTPAGAWSETQLLVGEEPAIAAAPNGTVVVMYHNYDIGASAYIRKPAGGSWEAEKTLAGGFMTGNLVFAADGRFHLVTAGTDSLYYYRLSNSGVLSPAEIAYYDGGHLTMAVRSPDLAVDSEGGVHLVFAGMMTGPNVHGWQYLYRTPEGVWQPSESLDPNNSYRMMNVRVDAAGRVLVIGTDGSDYVTPKFHIYIRDSRQSSFRRTTQPAADVAYQSFASAIGPDQRLHLIWASYATLNYLSTQIAAQPGLAGLSQQVNLPAEIYQPTLAWMSGWQGQGPWSQTHYTVEISNNITSSLVYSGAAAPGWSHAWVDLSAWAGQAITVSFRLQQAAAEPQAHLLLDNLSLAGWAPPQIISVNPAVVEMPWVTSVITLTGEHFLEGATVRLNDTPVEPVAWLDVNTLRLELPHDLAPGLYTVWVTNPSGEVGRLPNSLKVGLSVFLPVLRR